MDKELDKRPPAAGSKRSRCEGDDVGEDGAREPPPLTKGAEEDANQQPDADAAAAAVRRWRTQLRVDATAGNVGGAGGSNGPGGGGRQQAGLEHDSGGGEGAGGDGPAAAAMTAAAAAAGAAAGAGGHTQIGGNGGLEHDGASVPPSSAAGAGRGGSRAKMIGHCDFSMKFYKRRLHFPIDVVRQLLGADMASQLGHHVPLLLDPQAVMDPGPASQGLEGAELVARPYSNTSAGGTRRQHVGWEANKLGGWLVDRGAEDGDMLFVWAERVLLAAGQQQQQQHQANFGGLGSTSDTRVTIYFTFYKAKDLQGLHRKRMQLQMQQQQPYQQQQQQQQQRQPDQQALQPQRQQQHPAQPPLPLRAQPPGAVVPAAAADAAEAGPSLAGGNAEQGEGVPLGGQLAVGAVKAEPAGEESTGARTAVVAAAAAGARAAQQPPPSQQPPAGSAAPAGSVPSALAPGVAMGGRRRVGRGHCGVAAHGDRLEVINLLDSDEEEEGGQPQPPPPRSPMGFASGSMPSLQPQLQPPPPPRLPQPPPPPPQSQPPPPHSQPLQHQPNQQPQQQQPLAQHRARQNPSPPPPATQSQQPQLPPQPQQEPRLHPASSSPAPLAATIQHLHGSAPRGQQAPAPPSPHQQDSLFKLQVAGLKYRAGIGVRKAAADWLAALAAQGKQLADVAPVQQMSIPLQDDGGGAGGLCGGSGGGGGGGGSGVAGHQAPSPPSWVAAFRAHGLKAAPICLDLSAKLGLASGRERWGAPLPEGPLQPQGLEVRKDSCGRGKGLFATQRFAANSVVLVMGGVVMKQQPDGAAFRHEGCWQLLPRVQQQLRALIPGSSTAPPGAGEQAVWSFLSGAFEVDFPGHEGGRAGCPGLPPLELQMLGHGGLGAYINDPRVAAWDATPPSRQPHDDAEAANCLVVPVLVRGVPVLVLVALRTSSRTSSCSGSTATSGGAASRNGSPHSECTALARTTYCRARPAPPCPLAWVRRCTDGCSYRYGRTAQEDGVAVQGRVYGRFVEAEIDEAGWLLGALGGGTA